MKTDLCFVLTVVIFFFGVLIGTTFFTGYLGIAPEAFFPALATLFAAFLGAGLAFYLQDRKEKEKETDAHVTLVNEVIAALIDNTNLLELIQRNYINPHRDKPHNCIFIESPPFEVKPYSELNVSNLHFLWGKGSAQVTYMLTQHRFNYLLTLNIINMRSKFYIEAVHPIRHSYANQKISKIEIDKVIKKLGSANYQKLSVLTEDMIQFVDNTIQAHLDYIEELHNEIKKYYPHKSVLIGRLKKE
ncbi:MAG: hypothetical protein KME41_05805 [Candidatus Thiodiazotropha sp. (ex Lucina pensylvanica)]|nr:hypothetical protein [Candidatus Thiodiazotropha sp. (ex Lucina pensylvanica)]